MKKFIIDYIDVSDYLVAEYQLTEQKSIIGEDKILLSDYNLELINVKGCFNKDMANSFFYGRDYNNLELKIIDDYDRIIFQGFCRAYKYNHLTSRTILTFAPALDQILNKTFVYIDYDKSPAENIYQILINEGLGSYIDTHSFNKSIQKQNEVGLLVDVNYYVDNTTTVLQAVNQLSEMGGTDCFLSGQFIFLTMFDPDRFLYPAYTIDSDSIINQFDVENTLDNIKNQFNYQLDMVNVRDSYFGDESRQKYGERSFPSITMTNQSNISSYAVSGLVDIGILRIQRALEPIDYITFAIDNKKYPEVEYFDLNTIFNFDKFIDEYLGQDYHTFVFEIISTVRSDNTTQITAVRLN